MSTSVVASRIRERLRRSLQSAEAPRPSLNQIGLATGTDKASTIHDYLGVYENNLRHLRDEDFTLVEIGVHQGASVRMWEEYFSRAKIIGVDIKRACKQFETDRIKIRIGNQEDPKLLQWIATRRPKVVVDDGSHRWNHQIDTFRALWPHLPAGGIFVIEDIHTSFGRYAPVYGTEGAPSAFDFVADIARGITASSDFADPSSDPFVNYCRATIDSMVFLRHSVIIHKKRYAQPRFKVGAMQDQEGRIWSTDMGSAYDRSPAVLVGADARLTATFEKLVASSPVAVPPSWSGLLRDVTVYEGGPAVTADRVLLDETLNCARNVRRTAGLYRTEDGRWVLEQKRKPIRLAPRTDGRIRVLLKQTWDANYGHWLIDAFTKVAVLEGQLELAECAFVVNDREGGSAIRQVVLDSFALVGVGEDQVEFLPMSDAYRFEELVVPGTVARHPTTKTPRAIRFLESVAEGIEPGPQRRIYLSRNAYSRRRLVNEDQVLARLEPLGYDVVHTEKMSLRDQIAVFKGATHVVGNMGAAFANLAFSRAGVSVLALATEAMPHDYFYDIVCHKEGGRYQGLQGKALGGERPHIGSDFEIDLDLLDRSLEWLHPKMVR